MTDRQALLVTPEALAAELKAELKAELEAELETDLTVKVGDETAAELVGDPDMDLAARQRRRAHARASEARTLVLDVRWSLAEPDGRASFAAGHVPGAVYVDLESELSGHGPATAGRHPLPGDEALTLAARRWGLRPGDRVVAYDGGGNLAAARAWWLLRDAGIDVRLLDGAWPAWVAAGLPVETGDHSADAETDTADSSLLTLNGERMPRLTLEEVASWAHEAVLLDARAAERYSGEAEPIDPRAGHVPGARSLPTSENLDAEGRFLPAHVLRERFEAAGVAFEATGPEVAAYCGSGITASHALFALELAGRRGALFPGSWSQWANHPELPVATGLLP